MKTAHSWIGGVAFAAMFFGALHITSVPGDTEEQRAENHRQETIAAAKKEFARQRLAGLTDDANRMMHPIAQARTP